jgi:predicted AAA+ superfamily ATPase
MTIKAIVSTAMLLSLSVALAIPVDAATKSKTKAEKKSTAIYYRQSDPAYYAPPGSRQAQRLLVQRRSYLSAGTETKQHAEHYADYAYPLSQSFDYMYRNTFQGSFTRMPLADPWDIPGWPKY